MLEPGDAEAIREVMTPLLRDELMSKWRDGVRDGLKMANKMTETIRDELVKAGCDETTFAVLTGLMGAFLEAESINETQRGAEDA